MKTFQEYLEMALSSKEVDTISKMQRPKGSFDKVITAAQKQGKKKFKIEVDEDIFTKEDQKDLRDKYSKVYPGANRENADRDINSEEIIAIKDIFLQKAKDKLKTVKSGGDIIIHKFTGRIEKRSWKRGERWYKVSGGTLHMEMK